MNIAVAVATVLLCCTHLSGLASPGRDGGAGGRKTLDLQPFSERGEWKKARSEGFAGGSYLVEHWEWIPAEGLPSKTTPVTIMTEFRRQVPPPSPESAARAFAKAASQASYVSSVSDSPLPDGGQWVEYSLPMQGEKGFKKIMVDGDGLLTLTISVSDNFSPKKKSAEAERWENLKRVLRNSRLSDT